MNSRGLLTRAEAASELLNRKKARESLIGYTQYTKPKYLADPFHQDVANHLDLVEQGKIDRLMIFAPPRHGKSELSTRRFPAYYLSRNPHKNVISASYNGDFAQGFGRNVRDIIEGENHGILFPDVRIRADKRAADTWQLDNKDGEGGEYYAVGVRTGTTGKGAHLFLIDDPIKDREEADSETFRERVWDWYLDVVYTRLEEDAAIVLTLTRWHFDDLAGRLLQQMQDKTGDDWTVLSYQALAEPSKDKDTKRLLLGPDGEVLNDPLRRQPLEPLAPSRFSQKALLRRRQVLTPRSWSALYQQEPQNEEGGMFRRSWFDGKFIDKDQLPQRRVRVRAWDLGAGHDGDPTAGILMSKDPEGRYYVEHVYRVQETPQKVESLFFKTMRDDGKSVKVRVPQDPGQAGKSQAESFIRRGAGWDIRSIRPTGEKETRAWAFSAQCEAGNVYIVRGHWNALFIDELISFPLGVHDDQVDAASDAFNTLLGPKKAAIREW